MGTHAYVVRTRSAAPREVVWETLADVPGWVRWGPFDESALERPGNDDPPGVGAVRRVRTGRRVVREEITAFEPVHRMTYHLLGGLPVSAYVAEVLLDADGDGTRITWAATLRPRLPGTGGLIRRRLESAVGEVARALAEEADRRAGASG